MGGSAGGPGGRIGPLAGSRGSAPVGVQGAKPPENVESRCFSSINEAIS